MNDQNPNPNKKEKQIGPLSLIFLVIVPIVLFGFIAYHLFSGLSGPKTVSKPTKAPTPHKTRPGMKTSPLPEETPETVDQIEKTLSIQMAQRSLELTSASCKSWLNPDPAKLSGTTFRFTAKEGEKSRKSELIVANPSQWLFSAEGSAASPELVLPTPNSGVCWVAPSAAKASLCGSSSEYALASLASGLVCLDALNACISTPDRFESTIAQEANRDKIRCYEIEIIPQKPVSVLTGSLLPLLSPDVPLVLGVDSMSLWIERRSGKPRELTVNAKDFRINVLFISYAQTQGGQEIPTDTEIEVYRNDDLVLKGAARFTQHSSGVSCLTEGTFTRLPEKQTILCTSEILTTPNPQVDVPQQVKDLVANAKP